MTLDIYASDQEKGEAIKQWWRESARWILLGIIIGLLALFAIRSWTKYKHNRVVEASSLYQLVLTQKDNNEIYNSAKRVIEAYSDTPYGLFSILALAKEEQSRGDLKAASSHLEQALERTKNLELQQIISLRAARLLLAEGNPEKSIATLDRIDSGNFAAAYAEVRGDSYTKLGRLPKARIAYQEALEGFKLPDERYRQILQMKLDNIGQP
ncbi:hypothetical conserved protein [Candidatus Nitrosoglobus terrae]|uniref:Ancillary SecYEG translocon subunit n=1 Tax=Candidatus Nitrosoglobus terrae TaxID=1630141 RepID=A0A1Q2SLV4_9GAMM|nr:tetratricopeptide repeat protein [Candidatus Nitrosoglobus terrae]BAW80093.1 hypothetical conserved protein [Candidatus Nitrosoglobus terrae]